MARVSQPVISDDKIDTAWKLEVTNSLNTAVSQLQDLSNREQVIEQQVGNQIVNIASNTAAIANHETILFREITPALVSFGRRFGTSYTIPAGGSVTWRHVPFGPVNNHADLSPPNQTPLTDIYVNGTRLVEVNNADRLSSYLVGHHTNDTDQAQSIEFANSRSTTRPEFAYEVTIYGII